MRNAGVRSGEVRTSVATTVFVRRGQKDSAQGFNLVSTLGNRSARAIRPEGASD